MNWKERIAKAQTTGKFTKDDIDQASLWKMNPIAEFFKVDPNEYDFDYSFPDKILNYGDIFYFALTLNDFEVVQKYYDIIQTLGPNDIIYKGDKK